jgi:ribosomal protein S24E
MEWKNIQKHEKPLLSRTEITVEVTFSGATPSNDAVKKKLSEHLKSGEELLVIKKIATCFGDQKASVLAYLYKNKEDMTKIEPKKKEKKKPQKKEEAK